MRRRLLLILSILADYPLDTLEYMKLKIKYESILLTTNMGARGKLGCHHRVHADHDLFLFCHNGITILNLVSDPIFEILTDYCGTDIDNPLLRNLGQVWLVRKVEPNILM